MIVITFSKTIIQNISDQESYTVVNLNAEKTVIDYFFFGEPTVDTGVGDSQDKCTTEMIVRSTMVKCFPQ